MPAANKSDFVAKWVRTVSKQASSLMDTTAERPGTHGGAAGSGAEAEGLLAHMPALPSPPDSPQKGKVSPCEPLLPQPLKSSSGRRRLAVAPMLGRPLW